MGSRPSIPLIDVKTVGLETYGGFISNRERYLKSGIPLTDYMAGLFRDNEDRNREIAVRFLIMDALQANGWSWEIVNAELLERALAATTFSQLRSYMNDHEAFVQALRSTNPRTFDAFAWDRRDGNGDAVLQY